MGLDASVLVAAIIGALSGSAAGAAITSWLAPTRQYDYWLRERRVELCLEVLGRLRDLLDEFVPLMGSGVTPLFETRRLSITKDVRLLFSPQAVQGYLELDKLMGDGKSVESRPFLDARNRALQALYRDIGVVES